MNRAQLLAAEIIGYSFANYQDHLGIGNVRYDRLMPKTARTLEKAAKENWATSKLAEEGERRRCRLTQAERTGHERRAASRVRASPPFTTTLASRNYRRKLLTLPGNS